MTTSHAASHPTPPASPLPRGITRAAFGETRDGVPVEAFRLVNARGASMQVLTYGGIITALTLPDRDGRFADVVLGFDTLEDYLHDTAYMGALIGRYANRIAGGRFALDGHTYTLARNEGPHHLHGGPRGFNRAVWRARPFENARGVGLVLHHTSPHGDQGYPGTLQVRVTYTLTDDNALCLDYFAETDAPTPVSLTQHLYFNLAGRGSILEHELQLLADHFTPTDATQIPTGAIRPVSGTPFDFTVPTPIGRHIHAHDPQLRHGQGYDHFFVLRRNGTAPEGDTMVPAARVYEPTSGRRMTVYTTAPGVQFYAGNRLDGRRGKNGHPYLPRTGFCLETQHFPDAPNQPTFPPAIVQPGHPYRSRTVFAFSV
ncbi:MAG: aldose 1-epimerase [Rhodothermaceae bacterium]|nr:MAG: aldose 1-epimerase [Rhodothermaceae bacterium]